MIWVVGSGPAGISAALYILRGGQPVGILHQSGTSALEKAERIENYYGLEAPVSGGELLRRGWAQAERLGAELKTAQAVGLNFGDGGLELATTEGTLSAQAVILATGSPRLAPRLPGLQEFEGKGVSYCAVCDGFFCRGKDVAVLGSGEFALHEAETLLPIAASVTLLTNGEAAPDKLPEGVQAETRRLSELYGGDLMEGIRLEDGQTLAIPRLFIALGTAGSTDLARQIGAILDGTSIQVDENMATNVPGVFAAGDCTGGLKQVSKAVYQGAVAGLSALRHVKAQKQA